MPSPSKSLAIALFEEFPKAGKAEQVKSSIKTKNCASSSFYYGQTSLLILLGIL